MRIVGLFIAALAVSACRLEPQLAASAAGCYALQSAPIPDVYRWDMIPEPPAFIRLSPVNGGQVEVPVSWLEVEGLRVRQATLLLLRPAAQIVNGVPVAQSKVSRPLPPDTIGLQFSGGGDGRRGYVAWFAAQPSGEWIAQTALRRSRDQDVTDVVPMRLQPVACGGVPLGLSR